MRWPGPFTPRETWYLFLGYLGVIVVVQEIKWLAAR